MMGSQLCKEVWAQPANQTDTSDFKVVYRNGSWEIAMMSQDKEVKSTPLPTLNPNGVGYWYFIKTQFVTEPWLREVLSGLLAKKSS